MEDFPFINYLTVGTSRESMEVPNLRYASMHWAKPYWIAKRR